AARSEHEEGRAGAARLVADLESVDHCRGHSLLLFDFFPLTLPSPLRGEGSSKPSPPEGEEIEPSPPEGERAGGGGESRSPAASGRSRRCSRVRRRCAAPARGSPGCC